MAESKKGLRVLIVVLFPILFVTMIAVTFFQPVLQQMMAEIRCAMGNVDRCSAVAVRQLHDDDPDVMREGMTFMENSCKEGIPAGCRMSATFKQRSDHVFGGDTPWVLKRKRQRIASRQCEEGSAKGCLIGAIGEAAWPRESDEDRTTDIESLLGFSRALCPAKEDACVSVAILTAIEGKPDEEASKVACKAGYAVGCQNIQKLRNDYSKEEIGWFSKACEASLSYSACSMKIADKDFSGDVPRFYCRNGHWGMCKSATIADDEQDADVLRAFYGAFEKRDPYDHVGYSLSVEGDFKEACGRDVAEACHLEGLKLVSDLHEEWSPKHPSLKEIEATFGKACKLGLNASCWVGGIQLRDRPREDRLTKESNAMLDVACKRGHAQSCWAKDFGEQLRAGDYAEYRKVAEQACKAGRPEDGACQEYIAFIERDEMTTPWIMSDRLMAALNEPTCYEQGQPKGCRDRAYVWRWGGSPLDTPLAPGMPFAVYSEWEKACKTGDKPSCWYLLNYVDKRWPVPDKKRAKALREKVCAKVPMACK